MYDLHAHILPGVDDGAKTPEDTIEMACIAAKFGTKVILATPHRKDVTEKSSVDHVKKLIKTMNGRIQGFTPDIELVLGMENHFDLDLPQDITDGRALPMNSTRYILVEMPFFGKPNYLEDTLFKIQLQGLTPVLAHPERIEMFQLDLDLLASLVERGMLTQVTAGSVIGLFGKNVKNITSQMLKRNLVHILASDTHFPEGPRSPRLDIANDTVTAILGHNAAKAMVVDTPKAILDDQPIHIDPPIASSSFFRKLKFW